MRIILTVSVLFALSASQAEAFQETPLSCNANVGFAPLVRHQGKAERASEAVLVCSGGTPTPAGTPVPRYTVQITLDVPSASRVLDPVTRASEAMLLVQQVPYLGAAPQACPLQQSPCLVNGTGGTTDPYYAPGSYSLFQGRAGTASNVIEFPNIPIDPPGPDGRRYWRLLNLRADVSGVPVSDLIPSNIIGQVSIVGTPALTVSNDVVTAGYLIKAANFEARDGANSNVLTAPVDVSSCGLNPSIGSGLVATPPQFHVRVSEANAAGLMTRTATVWPNADAGAPVTAQNIPAYMYGSSETGFYDPNLPSTGGMNRAGLADSGTRFYVVLDYVPSGVTAWASAYAVGKTSANSPIRAMQPSAVSFDAGQLQPAPVTNTNAGPLVQFTVSGGLAFAVFEYTGLLEGGMPPAALMETMDIAVYLSAPAGSSAGQIHVRAGLGPVMPLAGGVTNLPQFVEQQSAIAAVTVGSCVSCKPNLSAAVTSKSGPLTQRNWAIRVANRGGCDAGSLQLTGAQMYKIGFGASPTLLTPMPLNIGPLATGGSTKTNLQFAVSPGTIWVSLKLDFKANGLALPPEYILFQLP